MKNISKRVLILTCFFSFMLFSVNGPSTAIAAKAKTTPGKLDKANAAFDISKMSDMSDYDPGNPVIPTGDTIKLAVVASHSGPASVQGRSYFALVQWAAHDINKRGGIWVDGKKKLVQVIKADHMSKPDQCKKICERMALQEKVHAFVGTDGSHLMKIINETANHYKIISINIGALADDLQSAENFSRYAFHTYFSTEQTGRGLAYYFGQIRKKEKKFYIINQDVLFGHLMGESFKKGLKEYYPQSQIVGEDYHKPFLTDFAPYLTKVRASGAEVIFSADFLPDGANLPKQAKALGINLPFANLFSNDASMLATLGIEASKGMVHIDSFDMPNPFKTAPGYAKYYTAWIKAWEKWKAPDNTVYMRNLGTNGNPASLTMQTYWLLSAIERAKSTDPEKIIKILEGDSYRYVNGKTVKIRACDHKAIMDLAVSEYVPPEQQKMSMTIPPYYWTKDSSFIGPTYKVPAAYILPWMDQKLDRCKGKNGWGE